MMLQDVSGTIGGSILDPSGAAVPGAKITITSTERNQVVRTVKTDSTGNYSAVLLPVGIYSIKVEASGFKHEEQQRVVLNVNDDLKINIKLQVGSANETVEVNADTAAVELGSPASATTIDGTQISELALGTRNYESLVALMPGVASNAVDDLYVGNSLPSGSTSTVPFSVNGMRNSANNWTVDGADNVDRGSNQTLSTYPSGGYRTRGRGADQRGHQEWGQTIPWQRVRVLPQRCAECQPVEQQCQRRGRGGWEGEDDSGAVERLRLHHRRADLHSGQVQQGQEQDLLLLFAGVA
jgi:hypothetical protein